MSIFKDRREAGRYLAGELKDYANRPDVLVLGLARGGVPVAHEIAQALNVPFDVFLVRKLGVPGNEELAMGAVAMGGVRVLNEEIVRYLDIPAEAIKKITQMEEERIRQRARLYRGDRPPLDVKNRTIILVDDGLATGASIRAAITALRQFGPKKIVVAVPVASPSTCSELESEADEIVCAVTPEPFFGVGLWYEDFSPTSDEEVRDLLEPAGKKK